MLQTEQTEQTGQAGPAIARTRSLDLAFASTRAILAQVQEGQLGAPTPCVSWDVRTLISHFIGTARWAASAVSATDEAATDEAATSEAATSEAATSEAATDEAATDEAGDAASTGDYGAADLLASYDEAIETALAAFGSAGVLEKTVSLPFGEFSGADLMGLTARDQFTHGWDLARAIGHDTDLDPELAGELLIQARTEITEAFRGPDGVAFFGPAADAPASASPADRLAAFLGRAL
jgi:uncharacterized protein (TIGR03086 family)